MQTIKLITMSLVAEVITLPLPVTAVSRQYTVPGPIPVCTAVSEWRSVVSSLQLAKTERCLDFILRLSYNRHNDLNACFYYFYSWQLLLSLLLYLYQQFVLFSHNYYFIIKLKYKILYQTRLDPTISSKVVLDGN